jgi:hypothetical protein
MDHEKLFSISKSRFRRSLSLQYWIHVTNEIILEVIFKKHNLLIVVHLELSTPWVGSARMRNLVSNVSAR